MAPTGTGAWRRKAGSSAAHKNSPGVIYGPSGVWTIHSLIVPIPSSTNPIYSRGGCSENFVPPETELEGIGTRENSGTLSTSIPTQRYSSFSGSSQVVFPVPMASKNATSADQTKHAPGLIQLLSGASEKGTQAPYYANIDGKGLEVGDSPSTPIVISPAPTPPLLCRWLSGMTKSQKISPPTLSHFTWGSDGNAKASSVSTTNISDNSDSIDINNGHNNLCGGFARVARNSSPPLTESGTNLPDIIGVTTFGADTRVEGPNELTSTVTGSATSVVNGGTIPLKTGIFVVPRAGRDGGDGRDGGGRDGGGDRDGDGRDRDTNGGGDRNDSDTTTPPTTPTPTTTVPTPSTTNTLATSATETPLTSVTSEAESISGSENTGKGPVTFLNSFATTPTLSAPPISVGISLTTVFTSFTPSSSTTGNRTIVTSVPAFTTQVSMTILPQPGDTTTAEASQTLSHRTTAVVGISIGAGLFIITLALALFFLRHRRRTFKVVPEQIPIAFPLPSSPNIRTGLHNPVLVREKSSRILSPNHDLVTPPSPSVSSSPPGTPTDSNTHLNNDEPHSSPPVAIRRENKLVAILRAVSSSRPTRESRATALPTTNLSVKRQVGPGTRIREVQEIQGMMAQLESEPALSTANPPGNLVEENEVRFAELQRRVDLFSQENARLQAERLEETLTPSIALTSIAFTGSDEPPPAYDNRRR